MKLKLPTLRAADGRALLHDEFHYTINRTRDGEAALVVKDTAPPADKENASDGWLHLTWGDALDRWEGSGWELVDAELDPNDKSKLMTRPGIGALVNTGDSATDLMSKQEFGDCEFFFRVMLPEGSDSGLYFMDRYELQLNDTRGQFAGVHSVKDPRVRDQYKGAGVWHTVSGRFFAPRFDENGRKTRNAKFEQIMIDGVMVLGSAEPGGETGGGAEGEVARAPLRFQGWLGKVCLGDVRVRPLDRAPVELSGETTPWWDLFEQGTALWQEVGSADFQVSDQVLRASNGEGALQVVGDPLSGFEMRAMIRVAEGGASSLALLNGAGEAGLRVALNASPGSQPKTASVLGVDGASITADLVPGGAGADVHIVGTTEEDEMRVRVLLNGVVFQDLRVPADQVNCGFAIELGDGASLEVSEARARFQL